MLRACIGYLTHLGWGGLAITGWMANTRPLKQENGIIRLVPLKNLGCRVKNGLSGLKRVKLKDTSWDSLQSKTEMMVAVLPSWWQPKWKA